MLAVADSGTCPMDSFVVTAAAAAILLTAIPADVTTAARWTLRWFVKAHAVTAAVLLAPVVTRLLEQWLVRAQQWTGAASLSLPLLNSKAASGLAGARPSYSTIGAHCPPVAVGAERQCK